MRRCFVLGLLGGIGSGKTTVAGMLAETGARVLDADAMCADLCREPAVRTSIERRWGRAVFDSEGELDRKKLAAIVFEEGAELEELNAILHPRVIERIRSEVDACRTGNGPALCVIDAPLLLESGLIGLCDATVFVECDAATRAARLGERRGWASEEIERREAHQEPLGRKRDRATFVVTNQGDLSATRKQVVRMVAHLLQNGD